MPRLEPVRDASGALDDVVMTYPQDVTARMLEYADATRTERDAMLAAIADEQRR